jgi:hypothetical protein
MVLVHVSWLTAQTAPMQWWFTYNQQARVSKQWGYTFDLNYRVQGFEHLTGVVSAARVGAVYLFNNQNRVAAGYAWFGQHLQGNSQAFLNEHRIWQQYQNIRQSGASSSMHRIRLEQRFREFKLEGNKISQRYSNRLRYMFQAQGAIVPLKPKRIGLNWLLADEIFLQTGEGIHQHYFDRNRLIAGVVWRFLPNLELATLYQYTLQYNLVQEQLENQHTIRITVNHNLDFRKQ